jgi:hypothetical protein
MYKLLISLLIPLCLNNCSAIKPPKTPQELEQVTFTDTGTFDSDLTDSMSANIGTITITPLAAISINQVPERLGKWLGAVTENQGQVEMDPKPAENAKSLSLIFSLIPMAYDFWKNQIYTYGVAKNYNATIFYEPTTGMIKKIEFRQKKLATE